MDGQADNYECLIGRIQQLEHERDELRKDIEQLCLQQAGPSYLVVATRMHFQRTAGLEQEIESLKKKQAACTRENLNLQEELSEAYRIKGQLADLHGAEVSKNMEAEKQVKYFQGCVAAAFAERDHSIMEAEKAKEREEIMSKKLNDFQKRLEELTADSLEEKELLATVQIDSAKLKEQNVTLLKVVDKFYEIRQSTLGGLEDNAWNDKCASLLEDSAEMWRFDTNGETSTSKYIGSLEAELETLRNSVNHLQNKLRVGLEIENHLKKKVSELEKKRIFSDDMTRSRISELRHLHTQLKCDIMDLLEEGKAQVKSILDVVEERARQFHISNSQNFKPLLRDEKFNDIECRDVHIATNAEQSALSEKKHPSPNNVSHGDTSDAFVQALQEKVGALLLLSQQEERHLLEKNVNAALQRKIEELQRNLLQVTNEKVKALMELAKLKQEFQLLQENASQEVKRGNLLAGFGDNVVAVNERDGKLKNLLKKTYLRRWIGRLDDGDGRINENDFTNKKSNHAVDFARMKVENASLKESMESMDHLTSTIRRLRLSLLKAKESTASQQGLVNCIEETLDDIVGEAKLVKTALGSSLPVSWSEVDPGSFDGSIIDEADDGSGETVEKVDSVSAAGFEMVELVVLACQILKENSVDMRSRGES